MPPYATHRDHHPSSVFVDDGHDSSLLDVSLGPGNSNSNSNSKTEEQQERQQEEQRQESPPVLTDPESTATTVANESREEPLFLERFMDFNPCASVLACPTPYITVFKTRICSECGRNCHKMTGYVREIRASTGDARGRTTTKLYFHKACARKREDRKHHKANGFGSVLVQLGEHFREIEREAEQKRREEALSKARAEKEAAAAAKPGTAGARNPPQGATPGEDAPPGGFLRRVGKAISKTTREMASAVRTLKTATFSWKSCHGKSGTTGAAEESAFRGHEF